MKKFCLLAQKSEKSALGTSSELMFVEQNVFFQSVKNNLSAFGS